MEGGNFGVSEKISRMLGGQAQNRSSHEFNTNAALVARKVEQFLASLREVEQASGTITIKVIGQPAKRVSFRYG